MDTESEKFWPSPVIWHSEDVPKEMQLVLSYGVDEGLGIRHHSV